MNKQETAHQFLKYFCKCEIDQLRILLTEDFKLKGPFYKFNSRDDYLTHLRQDLPEKSHYKIINSFEAGDDVCVVYEFTKPRISTVIAQLFKFREDKIARTLLVFDSQVFKGS